MSRSGDFEEPPASIISSSASKNYRPELAVKQDTFDRALATIDPEVATLKLEAGNAPLEVCEWAVKVSKQSERRIDLHFFCSYIVKIDK